MGELFDIPESLRDIATRGFNDLMAFMKKDCKLVYPPIQTACNNCVYDPIGAKSANIWLTGGPIPFDFGICPVCGGEGSHAVAQEEIIPLQFNMNAAQWLKMPIPKVQIVDGLALCKGKTENLPKVRRAAYMVVNLLSSDWRCELYGEPINIDSIVQGKFFVCFWKRS